MGRSVTYGINDNATLTFEISGGVTGRDPETNNPIVSTSKVTVRASLNQQKDAPRDVDRPQPGNRPAVWMTGWACDPAILPSTIPQDATCKCVLDTQGGKITGTLRLYLRVPDAGAVKFEVMEIEGQPLNGWFTPDNI